MGKYRRRHNETSMAKNSISKPSAQLMASLKSSLNIYDKVSTRIYPSVLSVHANQLLVGSKTKLEVYICSTTGTLIKTLTKATNRSKCIDAVWTQQHHIVCTVQRGIELVNASDGRILASNSSQSIAIFALGNNVIGVSPDYEIYVSTLNNEILTTPDHGCSWTALKQIPQPTDGFVRVQALTVPNTDTF